VSAQATPGPATIRGHTTCLPFFAARRAQPATAIHGAAASRWAQPGPAIRGRAFASFFASL